MPAKAKTLMENETHVQEENVFDGILRFTNWTDEDFTTKWDNVEYTFPAQKTVPLLIPNATPEQVQSIRKKFALDLATDAFYKSDKYKSMDIGVHASQEGKQPALVSPTELEPLVARCLEPLPMAKASAKILPKKEVPLTKDEKGKTNTRVLDGEESLVGQGTVIG